MSEGEPASVVLPTVEPSSVVESVAEQLGDDDELVVVPDSSTDPVASAPAVDREGVRVVPAGDPEGCSGKANAIATGIEAAENDLLVWTDDDFFHPPSWLASMKADYEQHGPVTEVPFFRGQDLLSILLEPVYAVTAPLAMYWTDAAWGGAVAVDRDDLEPNEGEFLADLGRSVSDDGLLDERTDVTAVPRVRTVDVGGTIRETLERHVRFVKLSIVHGPTGPVGLLAATVLVTALALLAPLGVAGTATLSVGALYAAFGIRRWTVLLAYPALVAYAPLLVYALARRTFVWGGRRYRWRSRFDVQVTEP